MLYKGEAVITSDYGFYNDFVTNLKNSEEEKTKITVEKIFDV